MFPMMPPPGMPKMGRVVIEGGKKRRVYDEFGDLPNEEGTFIPAPQAVRASSADEQDEALPEPELPPPVQWVDPSEIMDCVEDLTVPKFEWVYNNCVVFDWMVPDWMDEEQTLAEVSNWGESQPAEILVCN